MSVCLSLGFEFLIWNTQSNHKSQIKAVIKAVATGSIDLLLTTKLGSVSVS